MPAPIVTPSPYRTACVSDSDLANCGEAIASVTSWAMTTFCCQSEPGLLPMDISFSAQLASSAPSAPAQAANATIISPGITRRANERPPLMPAKTILLIVLVERPAKIGKTASAEFIFSVATSEETEIAAECVSAMPARAAATIIPASPNHSRSAAEATRILERVAANTRAVERLKALPP